LCSANSNLIIPLLLFIWDFNYRKWDKELLVSLSKYLPDLPVNMPQHISIKLEDTDSDLSETIKNIRRTFSDNFHLNKKKSGFGIVGLHPCGDLAATLLRLYTSQCETRFICIVGCCYMKLTLKYVYQIHYKIMLMRLRLY